MPECSALGALAALALAAAPLSPAFALQPAETASREATEDPSETLEAVADPHARMTVAVAIDGQGPYRFLLDTGSQATVVSDRLARELDLPPGPLLTVIGMAGIGRVASARIATMELGSLLVPALTAPLLKDDHIGADGIVGTDSLRDRHVLFDFTTNSITVRDAGSTRADTSEYEIVVRARRRAGRLIMTRARIDGIAVRVVIDTGSSTTVANTALRKALREKFVGSVKLNSVTGHVLNADFGLAGNLTIGSMRLTNVLMAFADAPAFRELKLDKRPALFLGMRELRGFERVAIDFRRRTVLFDLPG